MDLLLRVLTLICQHIYDVMNIVNRESSEMMSWGDDQISHCFTGEAYRVLLRRLGVISTFWDGLAKPFTCDSLHLSHNLQTVGGIVQIIEGDMINVIDCAVSKGLQSYGAENLQGSI